MTWVQYLRPTSWKERTNCGKLSYTPWHVHTNTYTLHMCTTNKWINVIKKNIQYHACWENNGDHQTKEEWTAKATTVCTGMWHYARDTSKCECVIVRTYRCEISKEVIKNSFLFSGNTMVGHFESTEYITKKFKKVIHGWLVSSINLMCSRVIWR